MARKNKVIEVLYRRSDPLDPPVLPPLPCKLCGKKTPRATMKTTRIGFLCPECGSIYKG